jgi:hypothetical protein
VTHVFSRGIRLDLRNPGAFTARRCEPRAPQSSSRPLEGSYELNGTLESRGVRRVAPQLALPHIGVMLATGRTLLTSILTTMAAASPLHGHQDKPAVPQQQTHPNTGLDSAPPAPEDAGTALKPPTTARLWPADALRWDR